MRTFVGEHDGRLLVRYEDDGGVFEASVDGVEITDVTLRLRRDGETVGSIYNDDGTERTMARLVVPGETDFVATAVPKSFVGELLDTADESSRIENPERLEGYRIRVLDSQ